MGELAKRLNAAELEIAACPVTPAQLGEMIALIAKGDISNNAGKQVLDALWEGESDVQKIVAAKGLKQMNDSGALEKIIDEVIAANAKMVEEFKSGKDRALNAMVGQAMKASKGQGNPAVFTQMLRDKLA